MAVSRLTAQVTEDSRYVYGAYTEMWDLDGNRAGPWAGTNNRNESMLVRAVREISVEYPWLRRQGRGCCAGLRGRIGPNACCANVGLEAEGHELA